MLNETLPSGTLDFLVRLRKIDKRSLTCRDVLVLFAIIEAPGSSGLEISVKLGLPDRSSLGSGIVRLEREGYIEDRREIRRKAHPAVLHATPLGLAFWDEIKP
jgi:DNA-binding MarR family transcriptional regulator